MPFKVGLAKHAKAMHLVPSLPDAEVITDTQHGDKTTSMPSAHHVKTTSAGEITSGRFVMDRMPGWTSGKILKGAGVNTNPTEEDFPTGVGLRAATKIVAASNSLDKTSADYVCDGTADQAEINSAITAITTTGGAVLLLEGTYYITASVILASNVALVGQGAGTVLKIPNGFNADIDVISGSSISNVRVANLKVDGNKANQTAGNMNGIYFGGVTFSEITSCQIENNTNRGIRLWVWSHSNIIRSNMCKGNGGDGIYIAAGSDRTTLMGNMFLDNGHNGIYIANANYHNVAGNISQGNGYHGIFIHNSKHNTIVGNRLLENSRFSNKEFDNIYLHDGNYNLIASNFCRSASSGNLPGYGIKLYKATPYECSRNVIHGNDLYDSGGYGDLSDGGYQTLKRDNRNIHGHSWIGE